MIRVVGVRFRTAGKIYFFDPVRFEIKKGDNVIVETARGIEFGTVVGDIREVEDDKVIQPLKPVLRIANERDKEQEAANKLKEKEAYQICLEKIRKHGLEMKLIDAEYTFDNNKVLFYFTADGRIDFRELVKDLASVFKTRIELRQIGVRDETKTVGGIGICGRVLCCHSYLSDFIPVSIKMAKEQNLSLNPAKISGVCGRLMCCLKHEEETYEELNRKLPSVGDYVTTDDGLKGEVQSVNVLRQIVKVVVEVGDEKEIRDYEPDRLKFKRKHGKKDKQEISKDELSGEDLSREELKELEMLEKQEAIENQESEGQQERGSRQDRGERSERSDKADRPERGDRNNRGRRQDRPERGERPERGDRPGRGEHQNRAERQDRVDRQNRTGSQERTERSEHPDGKQSTERAEYQEQSERSDRSDRPDRNNRQNRGNRPPRQERFEKFDKNRSDKAERGERPERAEHGDRQDNRSRQEKSERQDTRDHQEGRERGARGFRGNRQNRQERADRSERGDRQEKSYVEKTSQPDKQTQAPKQEGTSERNDNRTEG